MTKEALMWQKNNLIAIDQLNKEDINHLIHLAQQAKKEQLINTLSGKIIASCFFEPSTRTRLSFESAIYRLGASVIGFFDNESTSVKKGETLEDTIMMLNGYADAIVMRHPQNGSAIRAENIATIPVINAGDGANEHPTQTLLDLYTISEKFTSIDGLSIAVVGDLKYGRTAHSLCKALTHYQNIILYCVSTDTLQLPIAISQTLKEKGVRLICCHKLEDVLAKVDVIYMTRLQTERLANNESPQYHFNLNATLLKKYAKDNLIVMHPLPRVNEISNDVDETPYAWYFKQAQNGVYMRQAILHSLLVTP